MAARSLTLEEALPHKAGSVQRRHTLLVRAKALNEKGSDFDSIDEVKNIFVEKIKEADMKNGQVLWPVRCALS